MKRKSVQPFGLLRGLAAKAAGLARDASGALAIEFAMLTPAICLMTGGAVELSMIYLAKSQLDLTAQRAARLVMTRQTIGMDAATLKATLCADSVVIDCARLKLSVKPQTSCAALATKPADVSYDPDGNITTSLPYDVGKPSDLMVVQAHYAMFTPGGSLFGFDPTGSGYMLLVSTQVFPNEP